MMKKFSTVLMTSVLALGVVGCSSSTDESASTDESGVQEVTMWGSWSGDQIDQLNEQIETYNESQDKYEVKYVMQENVEEKLLTSIAGGEVPDVIMWDRYQTSLYASKGVLKDLTPLIEEDNVNMGDFYEEAVSEMTYDEGVYGIPLLVDTRILFYNKDLMGEEKVPTTWQELSEVAPKLTVREDGKLVQSGFSLEDVGLYNMYLLQAGGELISEDNLSVNFNNEAGQSVLELWDNLQNVEKVYDRGFDASGTQFTSGNLAMTYNGPWALADYDKVDGLNYGVSLPLAGPNGDVGSIMGGFGLVMPEDAKNQDGAWDFIKWWTTQPENGVEFAKISGWLPANTIAANDEYFTSNEYYSVFVEAMENAKTRPTAEGYSEIESLALRPQLENFLSGTVTAEEALSTVDEEGTRILGEKNK